LFIRTSEESDGLEALVNRLCIRPIEDWQTLSDADALSLIQEIYDKLGDDAILVRNSEALEKRYANPMGSISDMIFVQDLNSSQILEQLKNYKPTV